ncbi:hypothetical protein DHD80_18680 [Gramella sp. AN32]|nr:hypothetical protein [Gramella sp. AN32]
MSGSVSTGNDFNGKHTREKKVQKEFSVGAYDNLIIDNSYGNVDIKTWDQNRVTIEVRIKTNGNDEDLVEEKLRDIQIDFNQSSGSVSAKTRFSKDNRSWWKQIFDGSSNINMEINYIVRAPIGNKLDISNDYGGIYIDKTTGNAKINCDYGKIDIGELRGSSNYLNFDYTSKSKIEYITNAEINADYSSYEIGEVGTLIIRADYSDSNIEKVNRLEYNCDYGSISIGKVKELRGNGDYLSTKINRIFTSAEINQDYGSISIEKVIKGTRRIDIETDYAGVKLGYDNEMDFQFDVRTSYGGIDGLNELSVKNENNSGTSHSVSGFYGSSSSNGMIKINTSYGSVNFIKE